MNTVNLPSCRQVALMDIAEQCFLTQGYQTTSVNDVVQQAQIAKGTFYHYFSSKEALLLALQHRYTDEFINTMQISCGEKQTAVADWLQAAVTFYLTTANRHDALFHQYPNQRRNACKDRVIKQLTNLLMWQIDAPQSMTSHCQQKAIVIYHGMHALVDEVLWRGDKPNEQSLVMCLQALFLPMVADKK